MARGQGHHVIRFDNRDMHQHLDDVLKSILEVCERHPNP